MSAPKKTYHERTYICGNCRYYSLDCISYTGIELYNCAHPENKEDMAIKYYGVCDKHKPD